MSAVNMWKWFQFGGKK